MSPNPVVQAPNRGELPSKVQSKTPTSPYTIGSHSQFTKRLINLGVNSNLITPTCISVGSDGRDVQRGVSKNIISREVLIVHQHPMSPKYHQHFAKMYKSQILQENVASLEAIVHCSKLYPLFFGT
jgi:hypothetical protein